MYVKSHSISVTAVVILVIVSVEYVRDPLMENVLVVMTDSTLLSHHVKRFVQIGSLEMMRLSPVKLVQKHAPAVTPLRNVPLVIEAPKSLNQESVSFVL